MSFGARGRVLVALLPFVLACGGSGGGGGGDDDDDDGTQESWQDVGVANDDLSSVGNPTERLAHTVGLAEDTVQGDADHFDFDTDNYTVRTETVHGTEVSVAVHNGQSTDAAEFAEIVLTCFHAAWHIFGGYRYDKYAVKLRDPNDGSVFSLSEVGTSISDDLFDGGGFEAVCHEMVHSWIGKLVAHIPDGSDNLFQLETWISEGAVFYNGIRLEGIARGASRYQSGMESRQDAYRDAIGTANDLSVQDLANAIGTDNSSNNEANNVFNGRITMIAYSLDTQLRANGSSLDALLRYMYENFGLTDTTWEQDDILDALEQLVGDAFDYQGFFSTFLDTNQEITEVSDFELLGLD